jgi:hypothetical protein
MALRHPLLPAIALLIALSVDARPARAQLPTTPSPPPPTLWSFLGVPQGCRAIKDQFANRFGKHPGLERKPPIKALADPANLKSDIPEIKAAAEVKQAEDLKPQKVKAVKYLTEIGCGCYNKDGKITKALLAAMDDCTEDVRLATVEAIGEAAEGEVCAHCKERSCCNPKITEQLAKMAFERDDKGCWLEPSERVRDAARQAMCACCPSYGPPASEPPAPSPIETGEGAGKIERSEPQGTENPTPAKEPSVVKPQSGDGPPEPPAVKPRPANGSSKPSASANQENNDGTLLTQAVSSRRTAVRVTGGTATETLRDPLVAKASRSTTEKAGTRVFVDAERRMAQVLIPDKTQLVRVGTKVGVYEARGGKYVQLGEMEVAEATPGTAVLRPVGNFNLSQLSAGTVLAGF